VAGPISCAVSGSAVNPPMSQLVHVFWSIRILNPLWHFGRMAQLGLECEAGNHGSGGMSRGFWITRLHRPEANDSAVLRWPRPDEAGAQQALDASGLTRFRAMARCSCVPSPVRSGSARSICPGRLCETSTRIERKGARERIWLSPACLNAKEDSLFANS
jgi:hypothetical protein